MDSTKRYSVYEAARDGAYDELRDALSRMSIGELLSELQGDDFGSPLIIAAQNGNLDAVEILLRHKAYTEDRRTVRFENYFIEGCTPLWAAAFAGHLDVVKLLIEQNAEVDGRTATYSTPLRAAADAGHFDIVRYLVENRADVNARNYLDNTPLMIACNKGHDAVVKYLLDRGADIKLQDKLGNSALHEAASGDHFDIVSDLLALGAPQLPNNKRLTPLLYASSECKIEMMENIIKRPQCTKEQKIEALELLGGTIANDSKANCDTKKAFFFMKRGMEERFQDLSSPLPKQHMEPIEAYENRKESQTLEELALIEDNDHAIHMEGLMIRERILGTHNIELHDPLRYRGAVFADSGNYDLCIGLWLHAMKISQHRNSERLLEDLSWFCELCCEMIEKKCPPRRKYVEEVFETVISEYEKLTNQAHSNRLKAGSGAISFHGELETLVHYSLYLVTIFTKVQDIRKEESSGVFGLIQRFLSLNPCTRNGNTLLHLSVWCETPTKYFHRGFAPYWTHLKKRSPTTGQWERRFKVRNNWPGTYVEQVCKFPCIETMKLLISAGGNVQAINNEGDSPLHLAVAYQTENKHDAYVSMDISRTLLDAGVNKDLVNNDGKTAADVTLTPWLLPLLL